MGKQWKKGRFWRVYGVVTKPDPIKPNENLDLYGFTNNNSKKDTHKKFLAALIRHGIPCRIHNAYYLKEWRFVE